jgi:hypothetical protein
MQNNQILPENVYQGTQSLNIENISNNIEQSQQISCSKYVPIKAGQLFGVGSAIGGYISNKILPSQEYKYSQNILQGLVSHTISNIGMSSLNIPKNEKTNLFTDNIINVGAATVGGISGILAMKLSQTLCNDNIQNPEIKKAINDYILLAVFVTMEFASKPHIKTLCNKSSIFENLTNKDFLKINNISQKTVNFFINSLSGAVGAFCSSQYLANENINDTTKIFTGGQVFSISQNITKTFLTTAYNKLFNKCQNR